MMNSICIKDWAMFFIGNLLGYSIQPLLCYDADCGEPGCIRVEDASMTMRVAYGRNIISNRRNLLKEVMKRAGWDSGDSCRQCFYEEVIRMEADG